MLLKAPIGASAVVAALASAVWLSSGNDSTAVAAPIDRAHPAALSEPDGKPEPASFRLAVISDLNQAYGSKHYGAQVHAAVGALTERFRPSLVLITGDMVAGQKKGVDAPGMWRAFHTAVTEPLEKAGIALAPTPGNHDASPSFVGERAEYVRQWSARGVRLELIDGSGYPIRYSFSFGGAFFLSLDAVSVGPLSAEQRDWVEQQLARAGNYAVKIAFGHLPLYPIARGREREIISDPKLEAMFERYGVSVYASGHQHAFYPGATPAMRHLSMPCLGAGARALIGTPRASRQALVMLQVEPDRVASIEAFSAPDFTAPIARSALPPQMGLGKRLLIRDDLLPASLLVSAATQY
jgi:hypothetical protein